MAALAVYLLLISVESRHIDSTDQLISVGSVGLSAEGQVQVSCLVKTTGASDTAASLPRSLIFLTPLQETTYWTSLPADITGSVDVNRPSHGRVFLSETQAETQFVVKGLKDSPVLLNVYLHNPQKAPVSDGDKTPVDALWWWLFGGTPSLVENEESRIARRFVGEVEMEIEQADGSHLDYQFRKLADALGILAVCFVVGTGIYEGLLLTVWRSGVTQLHLVYVFAGVALSVYLFLASLGAATVSEEGRNSGLWRSRYLPEYAEKIYDTAELAVFLLTAIGYRIVRGSMTQAEWRLVSVILVVMTYVGFFEVGCEESSEGCGGYRLTRVIVSSLAFLIVIIGTNFHLATLSSQVGESALHTVGRLYQRREAYKQFRTLFLVYIVHPSIVVYYRMAVLVWTDDWAFITFFWLLRGAILFAVILTFRPQAANMKVFDLVAFRR